MTWLQFVAQYVKQYGYIVPASLEGTLIGGRKVSTQLGKRCRELRARKILVSPPEKMKGMEVFYLSDYAKTLPSVNLLKDYSNEVALWESRVSLAAREEQIEEGNYWEKKVEPANTLGI